MGNERKKMIMRNSGRPKRRSFILLFFLFLAIVFSSCHTQAKAEMRLTPPKSIKDFRLDDISKYVKEDPVRAVHLIEVYGIIYGSGSVYPDGDDPIVRNRLDALREEAVESLKEAQLKAIEDKRWTDAASYARSLARLGIDVENTGEEPDLVLEYAREQLSQGNNLTAFLGAVRAHGLKPLAHDDAILFLRRAAEVKQRRTAAFFLSIVDEMAQLSETGSAGSDGSKDEFSTGDFSTGDFSIGDFSLDELRAYAEGRDTASDMIKGVATVWVDRGYRIERGRGIPDRVLGSAFFVDASGLLITNYHVISSEVDPGYQGYSRMYIRMGDQASPRVPAKVIGWDKAMDLALIKTEITPEYVYSVVDWIVPKVGETVYAIGSPVGLEKTVTQGIVSALGRRFLQIGDVIQIDAAVNHGNSGGPVVDMAGRLVGIVFAGIELYQGLNFAVPAERLAAALPAMIKGGKAERPWLGLALSETLSGAEIIYTAPNTPAAEHRLSDGMHIVSINGQEVTASQGLLIPALQDAIFQSRPGELVAIETINPSEAESRKRVMMTVPRPDIPLVEAAKVDSRERMAAPLFGLILSPFQGSALSSAYLVKKVVRGSIADEAGISDQDPVSIRGFRILEDDGYALMEINVKKRRMGYMETTMQLPALLDSPDTL